jgi:hypothetical protein
MYRRLPYFRRVMQSLPEQKPHRFKLRRVQANDHWSNPRIQDDFVTTLIKQTLKPID